jgi:hypothetical protein
MRTRRDSILEHIVVPLVIVMIILAFAYIAGHVKISYSTKKTERYEAYQ